MGTKFANIQVYDGEIEEISALCPEYTVTQLVENWVTIVDESFEWGTVQKVARRLSKRITNPILTTEYFDDDYIEFAIYVDGKMLTKHIPASYEWYERKVGKYKPFVECFGLIQEREKQLRLVLKEENPERSLCLLECVLQCVLWVSEDTLDDAQVTKESYLLDYIKEREQKAKIKNQTLLELINEVNGYFHHSELFPLESFVRNHSSQKTFWAISDENRLEKLFEQELCGDVSGYHVWSPSKKRFVMEFRAWKDDNKVPLVRIYQKDGMLLASLRIPAFTIAECAFLDEDHIFHKGKCYSITEQKIVWDLNETRIMDNYRLPKRCTEDTFVCIADENMWGRPPSYLVLFDKQGKILESIPLENAGHWRHPIVWNGEIYVYHAVDRKKSILSCFDQALQEVSRIELSEWKSGEWPLVDEESGRIYFHPSYNKIAVYNMISHQIVKILQEKKGCYLYDVMPGVGVLMLCGDSMVEVWDKEMEPISKHRTKGTMIGSYHWNNQLFLLASTEQKSHWEGDEVVVEKDGVMRLYRLIK